MTSMRMVWLLLLLSLGLRAQPDSLHTLSLQAFYDRILAYHPVASQAALLPLDAQRQLQEARGSFDPKLQFDLARKTFGGTDYYNFSDASLKVPILPLGAELKAGHERRVTGFPGEELDPYARTPFEGLAYAGISLPLGQNLFIDSRRNTLRQAQIYQDLAQAEKLKMLNKLIFAAAKDYWNWYFAYQQARLIGEGYALAETRFRATRSRSLAEEAAPIDTVEALVTLQDRQVQLQEARLELQNARLELSNYLWDKDRQPLELQAHTRPDTLQVALARVADAEYEQLLAQLDNRHPEILKYVFKGRQLQVESRFRKQQLLPLLGVEYSFLSYYPNLASPLSDTYGLSDNHKLGLNFVFPLFLRKERGKLEQVRIKQLQNGYELAQTRRELLNELRASYNTMRNLEGQLTILRATVANQQRLVQAEYRRFELGESSLFLINTRENKLIDYRLKFESLKAKYEKARAELIYAAGSYR